MRFLANLICAIFIIQAAPTRAEERQAIEQLFEVAAKAAMHDGVRYAFTVDHWSSENGKETVWKAHFDPRRSAGAQWTLVGAELGDLDKRARKTLKRLQKIENGDDQLVYDRLGELLEGVVLQNETENEAVFVTPLKDDELPEGVMEAEIILNRTEGYVSQIVVRSIAEFKPIAMVKVRSVLQRQDFAAPGDAGQAFLTRSENASDGKAFFKKFNSQRREIFSDIEVVAPADLPAQQD